MADQEIITVSELDVADGASLSAEDQLLVHKATEGKMQRVAFSGLFSQESASRMSNDAALQLQINTMAGIDTDGETPTYRVVEKMDQSLKGVAGGVAELDSEGHVPASQLPSYVDDVIEGYYKKSDGKFYENYTPASVTHDIWSDGTSFLNSDLTAGTRPAGDAGVEVSLGTVRKYGTDYYQLDTDWYQVTALTTSAITLDSTAEDDPAIIAALNASDDLTISYIPYVEDTGTYSDEIIPETGKVYVDLRTNLTYRWGSTVYAPLSSDLALGETSATAYRGDRGKVAYEHSQVRGTGTVTADNPHGLSKADIGLGNVPDVTTNNQTPTYEVASDNAELTSGEKLSTAFGKIAKIVRSFISHIANTSNPHSVTKIQVGLGDVTNVATTSTITSGDTRNITSGAVYTALSDLDSAKQNKTLDTPLTIDGTSRTTVESALGSLNTSKLRQVTTMPASPSSGDTVLYLGSETGYLKGTIYQYDGTDWKIISGAGGGGTVAHFAAMSDWETARLITEGNEGYLADDSLVVIDATGLIYIQNGTGSSATLTAIDKSVFYVSALPTGSAIDDVIYHNTTDGKYYVGNKTAQTTSELDVESIKYVSTLPVTPNVDNKFYVPSNDSIIYEPVSVNLKDFIDSYCIWSGYKSTYAVANGSSHSSYGSNTLRYYAIAPGIEYYIKGSNQGSLNTFYKVNGVVAGKTIYDDYHQDNLPYAYGQFCEKAFSGSSDSDLETYCKREDQHGVFKNTQRLRCSNSFEAAYEKFSEINITLYLKTTAVKGKLYYGDKENQTLTKVGGNDIFVGTQAEWDALSTAEKNEYTQANLTDVNSVVHVPVDVVADGNMNPPTSNAVFDAISALISKGAMPTPTLTPIGASPDIVTTSDDVTIAGVNIGKLGNHAIHLAWTTTGYMAICVDTTVVAAIRGGTVIK